jgi:hypothetical protein
MVAKYASGKRRFDSYATETDALEAAGRLVRKLSEREVVAAAVGELAPLGISLLSAADAVAECANLVGDLANLRAAAKFYHTRKQTTAKRVAEAVAELLTVKAARGASARYLADLKSAGAFRRGLCQERREHDHGGSPGMAGRLEAEPVPPHDAAVGASQITDKKGFAARWPFSRRQVDNFLREGMPHCKVGARRVRIVVAEADAWMKERSGTRRRGPALRIVAAQPKVIAQKGRTHEAAT